MSEIKKDIVEWLKQWFYTEDEVDTKFIKTGTGTVTSTNIADGTIVAGDLADGSVTTAKIADGNVTNAKLVDSSIEYKKLLEYSGNGGSNTTGYVKLMQIKINNTYQNQPISFDIYQRGSTEPSKVSLAFKSVNTKDPAVNSFTYTGASRNIYIYKESTSTWSIIVQKSEAYDTVHIRNLQTGKTYAGGSVVFSALNTLVSTLPTSTTDNPLVQAINKNVPTEYIVGTHGTTATPTWTGKSSKISSLSAGQVIYYKMTSAGTSAGDTLNLTLSDGTTTTGAKNIYYNASTKLTTHFPINTILCLVYDGTNWLCTAIQNTNNYDRIANAGQVIGGEAITVYSLIYGKNDGKYYKVASGGTIDIRYPILWLATACASGGTATNLYNVYPSVNIQNTVSGKTVTASKMCYLEGTLSKGIFTISSNVFVTDDNLTDGNYYIPLGFMTSTTNLRFNNSNKTVYHYTSDNGMTPVGYSYSELLDKPSTFTPSSHSHGKLSNSGVINYDTSSVYKVVVTDSSGNLRTIAKIPFANLNISKDNITGLGISESGNGTVYSNEIILSGEFMAELEGTRFENATTLDEFLEIVANIIESWI